ncbi:MAG: TAXI family TRAP transporter solute-binding subunit, partial [Pirellulaceae bacterium]
RYLDGTPLEAQPMSPIRRCGCWCAGIPLVAALTGGAVRESTHGQQRAQAGIVLVAMGILVWLTLLWRVPQRSMPSTIRIAGGEQGGVYIDFANKLKSALESSLNVPVVVTESQGSGDSVNQLYDDRVDLAIVQAAAVDGNVHAIVSPLHYEYVHVIARKDLEAKTIRDLNGRRVGLGKPLTGSRLSANALVRHYGIETDANCRDANWKELRDGKLDATIVTAGLENRAIHELLNSGDFILLALPRAADIGDFNSSSIEFPADVYGAVTSSGITTVRTPAFLVTHDDASPELVKATLKVLYDTPSLKVFSKEEAETLNLIKWHVTARQFFHPTAE